MQRYVRGWLQRTRFRRRTELGKRQAARTAAAQRRVAAAIVFQKFCRRRAAIKRVGLLCTQAMHRNPLLQPRAEAPSLQASLWEGWQTVPEQGCASAGAAWFYLRELH